MSPWTWLSDPFTVDASNQFVEVQYQLVTPGRFVWREVSFRRETDPRPQNAVFSDRFENGVAQTAAECQNWVLFRSQLVPDDYTCVQITSSAGKGLTSCGSEVPQLAQALQDGGSGTFSIGGDDWSTGSCGSDIELTTGSGVCICGSAQATVRPCISNSNWGGVGGITCSSQPSQTMTVIFR